MKTSVKLLLISALFFSGSSRENFSKRNNVSPVAPGISLCGAYGDYVPDPSDTLTRIAPKLSGLGIHHHAITTVSPQAQEFFDQGLRLCYAFNHKEAHRSFLEAARLDPYCGMAYWGQAFSLGSNLNDLINDEQEIRAVKAIQKALSLMDKVSAVEKDYILALSKRYKLPPHTERKELNEDYVKAMKEVAEKYPEDGDAQELYADALMNTMPWNYWTNNGDYLPAASEVKSVLEKITKKFPDHPGAHHSYIHLVEGSNNPYVGVKSADALETLMPQAGHMIHMPAHIYIHTGRYQDAIDHNERAIKADEAYLASCQINGVYPLRYYPHNVHFLSLAYALTGQSEKSIQTSNKLVTLVNPANTFFMQRVHGVHYFVYARFGRWNEILTLPKPEDKMIEDQIKWHFVRGLAFVRTNHLQSSWKEIHHLDSINSLEILKKQYARFNTLDKFCPVALNLLKGEYYLSSDPNRAIDFLKEALMREQQLIYDEPAVWGLPVRLYLGAAYLQLEMFSDAEKIFIADLKSYPDNGWSLYGLSKSLLGQNRKKEAMEIENKFKLAWKNADVKIKSSVF